MIPVPRLLAIVAVASVAACKGGETGTPGTHEIGAETFVSQAPGNAGMSACGRSDGFAAQGMYGLPFFAHSARRVSIFWTFASNSFWFSGLSAARR